MKFFKTLLEFTLKDTQTIIENAIRLTNTQKMVLLSIFMAPTAELAYDTTTGAENIRQAAIQLREFGMVNIDETNNRAGVTDEGQVELQNNSLIDDMGQITPEGEAMLADAEDTANTFESADIKRLARYLD